MYMDVVQKGETYQCGGCKGTYTASRSEADVVAEAERNFGSFPEDAVPICDDCYEKFMKWFQKERPDLNRE